MVSSFGQFKNALWGENPVLIKALVLCPVVAITTSVENAIGLGLATWLVLLTSSFVASLLRRVMVPQVRFPCFLILTATFTTIVSLLMALFFPGLHQSLGIFVPLMTVSALVLAGMGDFSAENGVLKTIVNTLGVGLGFTLALALVGVVREISSFGTVFGFEILPEAFPGFALMALPAGGFLVFGFMMAGAIALGRKGVGKKEGS